MSDGGRQRASLGMEVWKSSQKWRAERSAVRSIAWLGGERRPQQRRGPGNSGTGNRVTPSPRWKQKLREKTRPNSDASHEKSRSGPSGVSAARSSREPPRVASAEQRPNDRMNSWQDALPRRPQPNPLTRHKISCREPIVHATQHTLSMADTPSVNGSLARGQLHRLVRPLVSHDGKGNIERLRRRLRWESRKWWTREARAAAPTDGSQANPPH